MIQEERLVLDLLIRRRSIEKNHRCMKTLKKMQLGDLLRKTVEKLQGKLMHILSKVATNGVKRQLLCTMNKIGKVPECTRPPSIAPRYPTHRTTSARLCSLWATKETRMNWSTGRMSTSSLLLIPRHSV